MLLHLSATSAKIRSKRTIWGVFQQPRLYPEVTETPPEVCFQAFSGHRCCKLTSNYDVIYGCMNLVKVSAATSQQPLAQVPADVAFDLGVEVLHQGLDQLELDAAALVEGGVLAHRRRAADPGAGEAQAKTTVVEHL